MSKHNFVNAQQMSKDYPDTFEAPTKEELKAIKSGDYVKVCHNDERFWVKVTASKGGKIRGTVANDLINKQPFQYDDEIMVKSENVYSILLAEEV